MKGNFFWNRYALGEVTYRGGGGGILTKPLYIKHGSLNICPKWLSMPDYSVLLSFTFFKHVSNQKRSFFSNKLKPFERIGPHDSDVISLIVGSLLGNTYLEKRKTGLAVRIIFIYHHNNVEFLMWFHKFLAERGYCSTNKPKLSKIIAKNNKVLYTYRFNSYSFSSFNWLHEMFYARPSSYPTTLLLGGGTEGLNNLKIIPRNLGDYLTPLALAVWFLGHGLKLDKGAKISIPFRVSKDDLEYLCEILKTRYSLDTTILSEGRNKGAILYINSSSMTAVYKIVNPLKDRLKPYPSIMDQWFKT
jgi:hypothetical protein